MSILSLNDVCFSYGKRQVLDNLTLEFEKGKMYCISGKSGAGKTTLLSVLSGLAEPDSGKILFGERDLGEINKYTFRSRMIGVVFQSYNLITRFTALENVVLSMDIAGVRGIKKRDRARELLDSVGLEEDEMSRRVLHLSGGQQQRVAIARALSHDPDIILADEPTGNLDSDTEDDIMQIFRSLTQQGKCVILVSHSPRVAQQCDIKYELKRENAKKRSS